MDFLNGENAALIDVQGLRPTGADIDLEIFAGHCWTEPSVDHLRRPMRRAVYACSTRKAARGLTDMPEKWDWRNVVQSWAREFDRLLERAGSE